MGEVFVDDHDFEEVFETEQGALTLFASVHTFGKHLVLDELMVYPEEEQRLLLGTRTMLVIFRTLRAMAARDGFEVLTVVYHRVGVWTGQRAGNRKGPIMSFTRRLP